MTAGSAHSLIDVLAFAPHPDDAELFCGGTLLKLAALGYRSGIIDLSRGELASQGSVELRNIEADKAAAVLGLSLRKNLDLPDGCIGRCNLDPADPNSQIAKVTAAIRFYRPELVLAPYPADRHPDHTGAGELLQRALFFSALEKYQSDSSAPFQPRGVLYYQFRYAFRPTCICDISLFYQQKLEAIGCYQSQIQRSGETPLAFGPLISSPLSLASVQARDAYCGAMIGAQCGEPFYSPSPLALEDPLAYFRSRGSAQPLLFPEPA
jgi:N-acetylglucosamine malate deacetylase 1